MKTQNIMASSYALKVSSTQNNKDPFFSASLAHGVWYYISMIGESWSFSNNSNLIILVDIQRLHENSRWLSCVSTRVYTLPNKKLSCFSALFYKIISFTADILNSPWWNNSSNALARIKSKGFLFIWAGSFFSFKLLLQTH